MDEERLKDSLNDRKLSVDQVPLPPQKLLTKERAFADDVPNVDLLSEYLFQ